MMPRPMPDAKDAQVPETFSDLTILPGRAPYPRPFFSDGGPLWPDFEAQTACRHRRANRVVDLQPSPHDGPVDHWPGAFVWGGYAQPHFGHLIAEHLTRLPHALDHETALPVLFFARQHATLDDLPPFFFELCAWLGLPRDRIRLVTHAVRVDSLRVWPQGEQINVAGAPAYLERLDRIARAQLPQPEEDAGVVYVTRTGMVARGNGGHIGEGYLASRLAALGVTVMDPTALPLARQLAQYDAASHLIFAEGSALHGRQLLGHRDQTIDVLNRRNGSKIGDQTIHARCSGFNRHDVATGGATIAHTGSDELAVAAALSEFDLEQVFAFFSGLGLDLEQDWDMAAFRAAEKADAEAWLLHHLVHRGPVFWDHLGTIPEFLEKRGWQDIWGRLRMRHRTEPARRVVRRSRRMMKRGLAVLGIGGVTRAMSP